MSFEESISMDPHQIFVNLTTGNGTSSLDLAQQEALAHKQMLVDLETELRSIDKQIGGAWEGQAAGQASSALFPLLKTVMQAQDSLHSHQDLGSRQSESFTRSKASVHDVPAHAPESSLLNDIEPWTTSTDRNIKDYNNKAQTNIVVMQGVVDYSSNNSNLPHSYGQTLAIPGGSDVTVSTVTASAPPQTLTHTKEIIEHTPTQTAHNSGGGSTSNVSRTPYVSHVQTGSGTTKTSGSTGGVTGGVSQLPTVNNPGNDGSTGVSGVSSTLASPVISNTPGGFAGFTSAGQPTYYPMPGENANTPIGYDSSGKPVYYNGVGERPEVAAKYSPGSNAEQLGQGKQLGVRSLSTGQQAEMQRATAANGATSGQSGQNGMPGGGGAGKPGQKENRRKTKYVLEEELDVGEILKTSDRIVGIPDEEDPYRGK
jgi:hypothetical protein